MKSTIHHIIIVIVAKAPSRFNRSRKINNPATNLKLPTKDQRISGEEIHTLKPINTMGIEKQKLLDTFGEKYQSSHQAD